MPGHGAVIERASGQALYLEDCLRQRCQPRVRIHNVDKPLSGGPRTTRPARTVGFGFWIKASSGLLCMQAIKADRYFESLVSSEFE